jgi:hypothetical protein
LAKRIVKGQVETLPPDEPWTPFQRATDTQGNAQCFDGTDYFDIYKNSRYTVMKRVVKSNHEDQPDLIHLSIKRNDKAPIMKWRDLQAIKNELVGSECEAIQLFPAESRLVDTSNQFHLFVFNDPTYRIPFGYRERLVYEGNDHGTVQEPFEEHVRPNDLISKAEMDDNYARHAARKNGA